MENSFYIALPSNASLYIQITRDGYIGLNLAKPLILNEPYEVGVIEIQYPCVGKRMLLWTSMIFKQKIQYLQRLFVCFDTIPRILKEFNAKCIVTAPISCMSL